MHLTRNQAYLHGYRGFKSLSLRQPALLFLCIVFLFPFLLDSQVSTTGWQKDLLSWRELQAADLQKADGWLTVVGLDWLSEGDNRFGSAADNQVRIEGDVPSHARWIPYPATRMVRIPTIVGTTIEMPAPGVAEFVMDGKTIQLEPVLESPKDTDLFFILRDKTSATTTYGAARFLYTSFPDHGLNKPGTIWLDFNRLQNPPCAYTAFATCPLPPEQNRLTIAIPAGEKRYHD
jgi:uncharacterized protein (DUF1684 family)